MVYAMCKSKKLGVDILSKSKPMKRHKGLLRNEEVNKVYGMSEKAKKDLLEDKCKKCKHLIDDHLRPALKQKKDGTIDWKSQDGIPYTCRQCGCEIT